MDTGGNQSGGSPGRRVKIPEPSQPEATCTIDALSVNPVAPQPVGTVVSVYASATCTNGVSELRFSVDGNYLGSIYGSSGTINWNTAGESAMNHTITVLAYDSVAGQKKSRSHPYDLTSPQAPTPVPPPPGPNISRFDFSPTGGAQVGQNIAIYIKIDSTNPGGTRIYVPCGQVSPFEHTAVEYTAGWSTNGCDAGSQTVRVCARHVNDPNWQNPTCQSKSYTLSSPPPAEQPRPKAQFWADTATIIQGQCTWLHWTTSNANRVEIDNSAVALVGDKKVCPPRTKHYSLKATGPGGEATRSLSIVVVVVEPTATTPTQPQPQPTQALPQPTQTSPPTQVSGSKSPTPTSQENDGGSVYESVPDNPFVAFLTWLLGGSEVEARDRLFPRGECTEYAAKKRPDVMDWLPDSGAHAKNWPKFARDADLPVYTARESTPNHGDLVVWQPGCGPAPKYDEDGNIGNGHVAYVETVESKRILVSHQNVPKGRGPTANWYDILYTSSPEGKPCMQFIGQLGESDSEADKNNSVVPLPPAQKILPQWLVNLWNAILNFFNR
jgi:surface antigen